MRELGNRAVPEPVPLLQLVSLEKILGVGLASHTNTNKNGCASNDVSLLQLFPDACTIIISEQ
jgi:hypothetical protein